nr:DUF2922 domain-containing protein [uncultured Niameybacter sp.]
METTKRSLVLTFGTPAKTQETITISNPSELLTGAEIKAAMTKMLASGAIGEIIQANSIEGAKYVIQQVNAVDLSEV